MISDKMIRIKDEYENENENEKDKVKLSWVIEFEKN